MQRGTFCINCNVYPKNTRQDVKKNYCCNKCPNHGPRCTKHLLSQNGLRKRELGLVVRSASSSKVIPPAKRPASAPTTCIGAEVSLLKRPSSAPIRVVKLRRKGRGNMPAEKSNGSQAEVVTLRRKGRGNMPAERSNGSHAVSDKRQRPLEPDGISKEKQDSDQSIERTLHVHQPFRKSLDASCHEVVPVEVLCERQSEQMSVRVAGASASSCSRSRGHCGRITLEFQRVPEALKSAAFVFMDAGCTEITNDDLNRLLSPQDIKIALEAVIHVNKVMKLPLISRPTHENLAQWLRQIIDRHGDMIRPSHGASS